MLPSARTQVSFLLLAFLVSAGCAGGQSEAPGTSSSASAAAGARATPDPASAAPAPAEGARTSAVDAPEPPAPSSAPAPTIPPDLPPWAAFTRAGRGEHWTAPNKTTQRERLGDAAAVAVIRTGKPEDNTWRLNLVRLAHDGSEWAVSGIATVETWDRNEELERGPHISAHLETGDFDDDGALEIAVRYQLPVMCRAVGASFRRGLVIFNDDEELSEAAYVELDLKIYRGKTTGRERFEDRNGDGHGDLVVAWKWRADEPEEDPNTQGEDEHLWLPAKDRFAGLRRPVDEEDIDCD